MDPVTAGAAITGLVTALTAYMKYRVDMKQAAQQGTPEPEKPAAPVLEQGQQALEVVERGMATHGTDDEKTALAVFQQNPTMFRLVLEEALKSAMQRSPEFAQQLQTLAHHAHLQTGGVQGNAHISSGGRVYGTVTVVNYGTISGSYTFDDRDDR
jgi:hypothetical protein